MRIPDALPAYPHAQHPSPPPPPLFCYSSFHISYPLLSYPILGLALDSIHRSAHDELLVLVAELGDLQEGVDAVALETMQLQPAGPVLRVHAAQRQAHAQTQVRRPRG